MSIPNLKLTNAGLLLQLEALDGAPLKFTRIALGDGRLGSQAPAKLLQLIHETMTIAITQSRRSKDYLSIGGSFSTADLQVGFWWRELGVYAIGASGKEILYCYSNAFEEGEYLQPDAQQLERTLTVGVTVGNAQHVTTIIDDSLIWATKKDVDRIHSVLARKAGVTLIGPASAANDLEPGGVLFITDGGSAVEEAVQLSNLLDEGYKAASNQPNTLDLLATVGVTRALNLRANIDGTYFVAETLALFTAKFTACCGAAIKDGTYLGNTAPYLKLSWRQVQYYLLNELLVSPLTAAEELWAWAYTPATELAALRMEMANLAAAVGEASDAIAGVVDGEGG